MLAVEGDVLLGPQPADELHELPGAGVAVGLVALGVAVGRQVVLAGDDVDQDPAAGEVVSVAAAEAKLARAASSR